jgi:hypothetical protein
MKTSTVIVLVVAFVLVSGMGAGSRQTTAVSGAAPQERPPVPQSGGGDTFNSVMALITATASTVGKALDLASDRSAQS